MMATNVWRSGAPEISQVQDYLFGGTWESDDVITLSMGNVTVSTTATSTVITTIVDALVTTWNALDSDHYPQFAEITASRSGNNLRLTMDDLPHRGKPFTCTLATTETGGGAADLQTIDALTSSTGTTSTANSSPKAWNIADNWSLDLVPIATHDVVFDGGCNEDCLYGLDQNTIALNSLTILQSYEGHIGLPLINEDTTDSPYAEYREDYLKIRPTTLRIGDGEGNGADRIKIDGGATAMTVVVANTSTTRAEDGVPCVLLTGTSASNSLTVLKGDVGVAFLGGETSNLTGLCSIGRASGNNIDTTPKVFLGSGVTLATVTIDSGTLTTNSAVTTLNLNGGAVYHMQGAITTINQEVGSLYYKSTSAITTVTILSGSAYVNAAITTLTMGFDGPTVEVNGQVTTLVVNSGTLVYASASTITTATINGGTVETNGAVTTLTVNGGVHRHLAGAVDVLIVTGGTLHYNSTGTLGGNPVVAGSGVLNFGETAATKTVTFPIEVYGGAASVRDPNKTVTTLVLDLNYDKLDGERFPIGTNIRLTRGTPA